MNEPPSEKRIIIDEDWKTQVERERDELRQHATEDPPRPQTAGPAPEPEQLPPASFSFLVTSLVTQTMAALGQFPDPENNERSVSLPFAKLQIDLLDVLQEKTRGNLSSDEAAMLDDALHHLRMLYISVRDSLASAQKAVRD